MCLSKLHLHAEWSIQWAKKMNIEIENSGYRKYLEQLMTECPEEQYTHIMGVNSKQETFVRPCEEESINSTEKSRGEG